ncbi:MAG: DUF4157 domain-containing protein [Moorea sp. SIO1G6]|nr:DUF4157 domain-containing protein [Moorena sp. SIO1G6]
MHALETGQYVPDTGWMEMGLQAKLTIGQPGDKYEQEADIVARQVVQQINSPRIVEEEEKGRPQHEIARKALTGGIKAPINLEGSIKEARGRGKPLEERIRIPLEQAMGADFSGVRVHTDAQSDQLNQSIQAKAFTTGQDVFFRQGEYEPGSRGGQELIAHELTHVLQQSSGAVQLTQYLSSVEINMFKKNVLETQKQGESIGSQISIHPLITNEVEQKGKIGRRIQRKTDVKYYAQDLKYKDKDDREKKAKVGLYMEAELDPTDPAKGSEPRRGEENDIYDALNDYYEYDPLYIKGHLLNAHLGGKGKDENLFPITAQANARHKDLVERQVKSALLDYYKRPNEYGEHYRLRYRVWALNKTTELDFVQDPTATLECTLEWKNDQVYNQWQPLLNQPIESTTVTDKQTIGQNESLTDLGWGSKGRGLLKKEKTQWQIFTDPQGETYAAFNMGKVESPRISPVRRNILYT